MVHKIVLEICVNCVPDGLEGLYEINSTFLKIEFQRCIVHM